MDDGSHEVVDWGEDDEYPQEPAESTNGGQDADALSLASDDEDDNNANRENNRTPEQNLRNEGSRLDESQEVAVEPSTSEHPASRRGTLESKLPQDNNMDVIPRDDRLKPHGLPAKPLSPVYTVGVPNVSVAATAMASRINGNHRNNEDRESTRHKLPPGWEERKSRKNETYYCNIHTSETQWELPTKPALKSRADSHERKGKREEYDSGPARRRSRTRSRERRASRRSVSPVPQSSYRARNRSRSFERLDSYRPARDRSPRGDLIRPTRDQNTRRRSLSRERPASPRPIHRIEDARPRSPPYGRDERDSRRDHRPAEPLQSSRRRSPPPKARSRERDERRSREDERLQMDVDRPESLSIQATQRRQRSWDSGSGDQKRRRLVEPPPASRGTDRYVPDYNRTSRMDVDLPEHANQDKKRTNDQKERQEERSRYEQRKLSPPSPKDVIHHAVGNSEPKRDISPHDLSPLPPRPDTSSQSAQSTTRSRAPLPPQADAMRMGTNRSRPAPMEVEQAGARPENAPTGPKADRTRVPHSSAAEYHEKSSQASRSVDERRDNRAQLQGDSYRPRDRQESIQNRPLSSYSNHNSNSIPIMNPRNFGLTTPHKPEDNVNTATSPNISGQDETTEAKQTGDAKTYQNSKSRHCADRTIRDGQQSRFGPIPVSPSAASQTQIGIIISQQPQASTQSQPQHQDQQDAPLAEDSSAVKDDSNEKMEETSGNDLVVRSPKEDVRHDIQMQPRSPETGPQARRQDGVRIDRARVSRFGPPPVSLERSPVGEGPYLSLDLPPITPSEPSPAVPANIHASIDSEDTIHITMQLSSGLPERPQLSARDDSLLARLGPSSSRENREPEYVDPHTGPTWQSNPQPRPSPQKPRPPQITPQHMFRMGIGPNAIPQPMSHRVIIPPVPQACFSWYPSRVRTGTTLLVQPIFTSTQAPAPGGSSAAPVHTPALSSRSSRTRAGAVNYAEAGSGDEFEEPTEKPAPTGAVDSDDSDFQASGGTRTTLRKMGRGPGSSFAASARHANAILAASKETTEVDKSYLGSVPPLNYLRMQLSHGMKKLGQYPLEQLQAQAALPAVLIPVRIEVDTDNLRIRDCFTWNLNESLITPKMFAEIFCSDIGLTEVFYIEQVTNQIRAQLEEYGATAALDLPLNEEREGEILHEDDAGPGDCRVVLQIDVQIGSKHMLDHIEWDLRSATTPEEFTAVLCADVGLSSEARPMIAHAIHEELLKHKKDVIEWGVLEGGGEWKSHAAGLGNAWGRKGKGPKRMKGIWRDWADIVSGDYSPRIEELTAEELEKKELERERAARVNSSSRTSVSMMAPLR
ncbi:Chromatin structure remodeling complex protein sfh1 [Serendipita sp. 399]|nr:Chromatin structure remodeling complex protein sfh1 [Serendipita sp. 399]